MFRWNRISIPLIVLMFAAFATGQTLNTSTTLAAETGNNTSAADSFATQSNGNLGASNISKVPLSQLLYTGSNTKIFVHFMPWFGGPSHMNVGYTSNDSAQVHRQVDDMMSRGVSGAIVDWYGPNSTAEDQTTQLLRSDAETRGGSFEFAVMEDAGALRTCASTSGCNLTSQLISDIGYINTTYFSSPAYMRSNGRPVLFFFGVESYSSIDWNAVRQGALGNPLFIFENAGGFGLTAADGGFSWIGLGDPTGGFGPSYLDNFYQVAQQHPGMQTFGSGYKGFNDTLAAWGSHRIMPQNCGQNWLGSMAEAGRLWSPGNQLPNLQVVTWNDYEEGSEIESGIDNCVSVTASVNGTSLSWTITGSETTIDHYTVFASADGQNLASLGDIPVGTHSFDLSGANLPAGNYSLYVKATGKPSLTNKMSAAVSYSSSGSAIAGGSGASGNTNPASSPGNALGINPGAVTVAQGQTGSATLDVGPQAGFQGSVSFACSNLPPNAQCSFAPSTVNVTTAAASTTLSIATGATSAIASSHSRSTNPMLPWWNLSSSSLGITGLVFAGKRKGFAKRWFSRYAGNLKSKRAAAGSAIAILALGFLAACGGTAKTSSTAQGNATPKGNYQITVTATSGSISRSSTLTLAVQ